jgi:hypothetical protein
MTAVRKSGRWLPAAAALLVLLIVGVLAWEWEQGRQLERGFVKMYKLPKTAIPPLKIQSEFKLPDMETGFPELLARPLFFASRRPMSEADQGAGGMKKGQFVLVGVVITPDQHSALLRDIQSNKTETVAMGGQIRGLTLGEVEANKVVLRMGAESEELTLRVQVGSKPPSPQPAAEMPQPQAAPGASAPLRPGLPATSAPRV